MWIKQIKKYYVGGLISLIFLPLFFLISTSEIRKNAIHYGIIEVIVDYNVHYFGPETTYIFQGNDESINLSNFQQFCQNTKSNSRSLLITINLPKGCSHNFFIQVLDILQGNKFAIYWYPYRKSILGYYHPKQNYHQESEPVSMTEEVKFIYSELSKFIYNITHALLDKPINNRVVKYTDLVDPPSIRKEEPRSLILFQAIDLWLIPIILLWTLLLIVSLRRNRRLFSTHLKNGIINNSQINE